MAVQVASLFLRELEYSPSPVLRNNLLIILTDICVRFTSLVGKKRTHAHTHTRSSLRKARQSSAESGQAACSC